MPSLSRCVFGCVTRGVTIHNFPNPSKFPERFRQWVNLVGAPLAGISDAEIYEKKKVCDVHFTNEDHNRNKRLNALAVPSLCLPHIPHVGYKQMEMVQPNIIPSTSKSMRPSEISHSGCKQMDTYQPDIIPSTSKSMHPSETLNVTSQQVNVDQVPSTSRISPPAGSELEGTDIENSDTDDCNFHTYWPKLVRAVYTYSDDEDDLEKELEEMSTDTGSDYDTSGSEIDEDRLTKYVYRDPYSSSDESFDEIDENSCNTDTPLNINEVQEYKFHWQPIENTQQVNKQKKIGKPGSKKKYSQTRKTASEKARNKKDISGSLEGPHTENDIEENMSSEDRREKFCNDKIGPTQTYANPYEAFIAIWDQEIMKHIVTETNRYARQLNINQWQDTTIDEIYIYLGIVLANSLFVIDFIQMSNYPYLMPHERFKQLTNCIHFIHYEKLTKKKDDISSSQAKLLELQPLVDHLNEIFSTLYNVGQNICLDEGLTQWRGWIVNTQQIGIEPDPVEIKSVEICEPSTGYLWRFKLVPGDITGEMIPGLVIELLKGLERKGHTVWLDKFYSSPSLARQLKQLGFDCAGLVQKSYLPTEVLERVRNITTNGKIKNKKMSRIHGSTSGDVDIFAWITKNRCEKFITTYHGTETVRNENLKTPKIKVDYDLQKCGVHRKDNLLFKFPTDREHANVWYKMFFRKLLNASILNAHILYNKKDMKHYVFREKLCSQIFNRHRSKSPSASYPPESKNLHIPAPYASMSNQKQTEDKCWSCENMTEWYCHSCKYPLCESPCFDDFHADSEDDLSNHDHCYHQSL